MVQMDVETAFPAGNLERLFFRSGRVLLLIGVLLIMTTVGEAGTGTSTMRPFLVFLLFILGGSLIMLSPLASQLTGAARIGAAMPNAVVNYFSARYVLGGLDLQKIFLDAGRVSVLDGWLVLTYSLPLGSLTVNAVHVILGFALLLAGVFLLTFSPMAPRN